MVHYARDCYVHVFLPFIPFPPSLPPLLPPFPYHPPSLPPSLLQPLPFIPFPFLSFLLFSIYPLPPSLSPSFPPSLPPSLPQACSPCPPSSSTWCLGWVSSLSLPQSSTVLPSTYYQTEGSTGGVCMRSLQTSHLHDAVAHSVLATFSELLLYSTHQVHCSCAI